jgi:hypothetical protein
MTRSRVPAKRPQAGSDDRSARNHQSAAAGSDVGMRSRVVDRAAVPRVRLGSCGVLGFTRCKFAGPSAGAPRTDDLGILAQIVRPSAGGVAPDCYFTGLGLILSQNAHW